MVKPIPDGYSTVTPYIIVDGAAAAIAFYAEAFGAKEVMRLPLPGTDRLMHAEITIGGDHIMLSDANPDWGSKDPKALGGNAGSLSLYVPDVDKSFEQAVAAGATVKNPPMDMFWGDRMACVVDPFGHSWMILTHTRDLTPQEIQKNFEDMMASGADMCPDKT